MIWFFISGMALLIGMMGWIYGKIGEERGKEMERTRVRNLIGMSMERKATGELIQLERAVRNGLVELD